jgi:phosphoglycolate phosphatase
MIPAPAGRALPLPRALLFDWDNTLVDSWDTIHHALNMTLASMGRALWTLEETKERVRHSLRDSFPNLFGARWEEARGIYLRAFTDIHLERLRPLPGAGELLAALVERGLYLGVVSNKTGRILRLEADSLGWTRHFGRLVGAGDAVADKPEIAPVALALDGSGIVPGEDVWLIGDTGIDVACAVNAGCIPILIGGEPSPHDFAQFAPMMRFGDCTALKRYIEDL